TISNIGNAPITNIVFDTVQGVTNFTGGPIASLAAGATDTTSFEAFYVLTQNDISTGYVYNYFFTTFNGIYSGELVEGSTYNQGASDPGQLISLNVSNGLKLNAFIDSDSNSAQNGLEVSFPYGNYDYSINGGIVHNVYTSTFHHLYESDPSNVYNLTYNVDTPYYPYNSCATSYSNVTVPTASGITTKDFPIIAIPYQDLSVYLMGSSSPRPGEPYRCLIVYRNYSNQLVPSGTITFNKPTNASIVNTSQSGVVINATGFTYNFTNLLPYETRTITIEMLTPTIPTVNLGDLLVSSASINEPTGDIVPLNNNSNLVQVIVGAYDPNDKMESHGGKILFSSFTPNDYLTYTIRFENTGTANANFVKITDVLDDKLEPSSIKMVHASADYILERVGASLTWKFNGINLPPSVEDTTIGKGYVIFQVKPKPGYAVGDIIPNFANIYFDTNPAIVTNTFNTEFVATLGSSDYALTDLKYYPNPVKNSLTISNNFTIEKIEVNSILGQTVLVKEVNDLQTTIDFSSLTNGVYFITVTSQGENKVIKIIKE
ncbi:MAG TPA: T9SS type A sorting domain-containing protein, partial [Flavobacterium sp.]|nr:T9SS type A sorting domain-containing protein [Flavobacterium sp.]